MQFKLILIIRFTDGKKRGQVTFKGMLSAAGKYYVKNNGKGITILIIYSSYTLYFLLFILLLL